MTDDTHDDTIDWNRFWRESDDDARESAVPSAHHVRGLLADFFAEKGVPDSFASVGCGPGVVAFDVAERHPATTVVGYDAAEPILAENRERAREDGVENARFERAVLPEFDPGRAFDCVLCYGTLCYVSESERALRNLYDAVAPGGYLVLGYMNRIAAAHHRRALRKAEAEADGNGAGEAALERRRERFELVREEESTLSYRRIRDAVGAWPRSFWEVTEKPEKQWAWRHAPTVWVPR